MTTMQERADRLEQYLGAGLLLRRKWRDTGADGRHRACALVALYPEVGDGDYSACPAEEILPWLAHLIPWWDDSGTAEKWPGHMRRLAAIVRRMPALDAETQNRLDYRCRAVAVREAMCHTADKRALGVCRNVLALLDRAWRGDIPTPDEWAAARAASVAVRAARAPTWCGWAAARAARAAARGASAAVWAAVWAASAATSADTWVEAAVEPAAAADRIIEGQMAAIESALAELDGGEG